MLEKLWAGDVLYADIDMLRLDCEMGLRCGEGAMWRLI